MEDTLSTGKAAKILGVTVKTLQRWDRAKTLVPAGRSHSNRRLYTLSQLRDFQGLSASGTRRIVAYCRVSSRAQKPDLLNQKRVLEEFVAARGLDAVEFLEEIGGGLNFKRPRFVSLMEQIGRGEVRTLVLAHRDRLTRFGYDWFEHYAKQHGCDILVLNQEHLSPEQEMVEDLMTIVHCFSSRLYGLRNYRKKLGEALRRDVTRAEEPRRRAARA